MDDLATPIVPPAPYVHRKPLPKWRVVAGMLSNPLAIYSETDFVNVTTRSRVLGRTNIGFNEPAAIRHVLTTSAMKYGRPVAAARGVRWMLGEGLLLAEGEDWRRQRKMLAPLFSPARVGGLLPHFQAAGAAMLRGLGDRSQADLFDTFNQATVDSVLRALFSTPAEAQGGELAGLLRSYLDGPGRPTLADALAHREHDFGFLDRPRRAFRSRWLPVVDALIEARRREPAREAARDLLDLLLAARDPETGNPLPLGEIRDQCATMIFAGFETTSRLMFWTAYLLALDQAEQARIRREVAAFPPDRVSCLADLENWPRLRRALLEALRLYPPVALLVREAREPDEVMGQRIEPGDLVWISPWCLHRHRDHWEHPTAFMPDRFIGEGSPWTHGPFMPFGGGPRICIGAGFALAEAQVLTATLLEQYEIGLLDARPVLPVGKVTTVPDHHPRFALRAPRA